jgi:ubiquinone/menaquinone biosynthesis C-methylase UbiE
MTEHATHGSEEQPAAQVDESKAQKLRTKAIYSSLASAYSRFRVKDGLESVLELLDLREGLRVLDVGTGPGLYAIHIAENWPGCSVYGVDNCDRILGIARERAGKLGSRNIHFSISDADTLSCRDGSFDRLLYCSVLVLIPDKKKAIEETYRALKPGGIAVFKELLHKWFLHKELFYLVWKMYVGAKSLFRKELRGLGRRDYEGSKLSEESMTELLEKSPFTDYEVFTRGTRLYAVCRK